MGILLLGSSSAFNGKKVQMGVNYMGISGGYEFKNLFLTGQGWGFVDPANYNFDSNGYPTKIVGGSISNFFYIPTQAQRSGNYVMLWDGEGTMLDPGGSFVSGSLSSAASSTNNRYVFTPGASTITLAVGISAVGSPTSYITNIRVCHVNDESAVLADPWAFGDKFLTALRNFGVVRMMNWFGGNGLNNFNISLWDYRKPKTYAYMTAAEIRSAIYAGVTTNIGDAYTLSAFTDPLYGSGGPQDKQTILVKFNTAATGTSPTLTMNGVTKPILRPDGVAHFGGSNTGRPGTNLVAGLTFDAMLDGWINNGSASVANYLDNGVPPEILLKLAREVGAHPYFVCPTLGWIPSQAGVGTNVFAGLAAFCLTYAESWMIPRFEGPNELWNTVTNSQGYAQAYMLARNGGGYYYGTPTTPFTVTAVPSYTSTTATMTGSGTLPPVGAKIITSNPFGAGTLFSSAGREMYVTATSAGSVSVEYSGIALSGTFSGSGTLNYGTDRGDGSLATNFHDFYGEGASRSFNAVASAYSVVKANVKSTTKFRTLIGVKTGTGASASEHDPRMNCRGYVLRTGGDPASDWTNGIAAAQYITPDEYGTGTETSRVTAYAPWVGVASISGTAMTVSTTALPGLGGGFQIGSLSIGSTIFGQGYGGSSVAAGTIITGGSHPNWVVSPSQTVASMSMRGGVDLTQTTSYIANLGVAAGGANFSVATNATHYNNWGIWANAFGVKEMHGYEGGFSPDFANGGTTTTDQFRHAAQYEATLGTYTTTNYNNFTGIGTVTYPSGFHAYFPSCYNLYGYINGGYAAEAWATLFDIYEVPDTPQYAAIKAFV